MDLDYKRCKYFKEAEEKEHCPFSSICRDNCIFTLNGLMESYDSLSNDYDNLQQWANMQYDNQDELDSVNEEFSRLEYQFEEYKTQSKEYIKMVLESLGKYEEIPLTLSYMDELNDIDIIIGKLREEQKMWSKGTDPINVKMVVQDEKYKPTYANSTDACMDLKIKIDVESGIRKFNNGQDIVNYVDIQGKEAWLLPGETRMFGSGLQVAVPEDYVMLVDVRSSTGAKLKIQLANTIGVIDAGYRDEVKVCVHNFGKEPVKLEDGQRLCQFFIIPRPKINASFVEDNEEFRTGDRGGGFGSTGVK